MLNEYWEYNCYLSGEAKAMPLRKDSLHPEPTRNPKWGGMHRVLQVLARGFLEICSEESLPAADAVTACRLFLYTWVSGEAHEDLSKLSLTDRIMEELQRAKENSFLRYARQIGDEKMAEQCPVQAKKWIENPYRPKAYSSAKNIFNKIYFDHIIADALYFGPLQARCLALKVRDSEDNSEEKKTTLGIKGSDKERKIALAIVAKYLQLKDRIGEASNQSFIPIVQGEIANWVNVCSKKDGKKANEKESSQMSVAKAIVRAKVGKTGRPLLEKIDMGNCMKICVDPEWLTDIAEVKLIPLDDAGKHEKAGYCVFDDDALLLNKRKI